MNLSPADRIERVRQLKNASAALLQEEIDSEDSVICTQALLVMRKRGWKGSAISSFLPALLDRALQDNDAWFLRSVLANLLTEREDLKALLKTRDWNTYLALANNPYSPQSVLDALANLPVVPSEKIPDRYDVIRAIARARGGVPAADPPAKEDGAEQN